MQHLPRRVVICLGAEARILFAAVHFVARQRKAEVLEMHADLVGAPGVKNHLHECGAMEALEEAETGARLASAARFGSRAMAAWISPALFGISPQRMA
jgi:hypothetical protein